MTSSIELICKIGRWLATARALYIQTYELLGIAGLLPGEEQMLDDGQEL